MHPGAPITFFNLAVAEAKQCGLGTGHTNHRSEECGLRVRLDTALENTKRFVLRNAQVVSDTLVSFTEGY